MEEEKFNRLNLTDRANWVWDKGEFVDSVMYDSYCVMLYSVSNQFVEIFMDVKNCGIVWISFANEYDLAKYLNDIHIDV